LSVAFRALTPPSAWQRPVPRLVAAAQRRK